jgi:hypothetical protein
MMGDYHVRFCDRLGVKFPLPTRLLNVNHKLETNDFINPLPSQLEEVYTRYLSVIEEGELDFLQGE